ncbi:hypothetical protein MKEN_01337800 [Mycena kentingensis (nom. inval.)]|nr:hypothetical protein MKEN_01337800 [Mycena kentingensis (nom. inval.)]
MLPWLDDGDDSDTGERDLPTCVDFELNRPIHKSEDIHIGHRRRFNRAGRAIIRIMAAHGWTAPAIGYVFVEEAKAVRRALENTTDDDLTQDYRHAPAEYRLKYPPKNPPLQSASAPATSANTPVMAPFIPSSLRATSVPSLPKSLAPPAVAAWMPSTTSASSPSPPPEPASDPAPARPPKRKSVFDLGRRPPSAATITHMKLQYSLMLPPSHPCVAEAREAAANRPRAPSPPPLPSPLSPMRVLMSASVADQESTTSSSDVIEILTTNANNSQMSVKPRLQSSSLPINSASAPPTP